MPSLIAPTFGDGGFKVGRRLTPSNTRELCDARSSGRAPRRAGFARPPDEPTPQRHPERFHEERSEIAAEIVKLARELAPRRLAIAVKVDVTDERTGRLITGQMVVNGRRIVIQKRRAFAISGK
jgi:hypothetical protein